MVISGNGVAPWLTDVVEIAGAMVVVLAAGASLPDNRCTISSFLAISAAVNPN